MGGQGEECGLSADEERKVRNGAATTWLVWQQTLDGQAWGCCLCLESLHVRGRRAAGLRPGASRTCPDAVEAFACPCPCSCSERPPGWMDASGAR
ncbi:uncharacterized protein K460DRAFT_118761 [Cucurbitaria berberidis CBS 394.84]|uniref:Uncharacterized protein n=1 Tax=Cucurbitaria berberidis CBS 394.84 TaxID=1168544 RepID=A0A9P4GIX5_9PLEO|nr:uncharacterized protein K460DRAFT_118761 [Cucurbitaria berberidis CBS 394.84]KAF1846011.1 hypothetical protein K460DRAFT_118761 [Cucurbitaria berberidis CBS 394.84]